MSRGLKHEEADNAAWEAGRGAVVGATRVSTYSKPLTHLTHYQYNQSTTYVPFN